MDPISIALLAAKAIPMISGWLGGDDAEDKATKIVGTIENITGLSGKAAVDAMSNDPALIAQAQDQIIKEMEIHAKDRGSARRMQTALAKSKHASAYAPAIISLIVTVGFFGMMWVVFNQAIPEGSEQLANILLGVLGAGFTQTLNFWLGSSKSSQDKTHLMGVK